MKNEEKDLLSANIVPYDHKYAKSCLQYNIAHGFFKIRTDNVDLVWEKLVKYNYSKELFTLFPSRKEGTDIIVCKYVSRTPFLFCEKDEIDTLTLQPADKGFITLPWLKANIYVNLIILDGQPNERLIGCSRGFHFDRTIKEILAYYRPQYVWNNDSKNDRELPIIVDDIMKNKIYNYLDSKAGEINEYLIDKNGMVTSLARILNLTHCWHIDSAVPYNKYDVPNIITRYRIKGFKKHFDVAAELIRNTSQNEQTYINKVETEGNKAIIEVINIKSFPWWSSVVSKCKTIPELRYYIESNKEESIFLEDECIIDSDYRIYNAPINMDFNISGIDHYQFDNDSKILDTDTIFEKEQDYMQEALNVIKDRIDSKKFGTSDKVELNLKFLYEETVENGEIVTIITNTTEKTGNVDIDSVLNYIKSYKTVFGFDGDIRESIVVGDESKIKETTNLISIIRCQMGYAGLIPASNLSATKDIRYYVLNGLKSNEFGASVYFGNVMSHVMFTVTIETPETSKPVLSDKCIDELINVFKQTISDGYLSINRKKVTYERID